MARVPTLLMVSLLSASAAFAQTAPPTQASIREVMNRVHGYLLTATPLRPVNGDTGAAVTLDTMPQNVALASTVMHINTYEWGVTYAGMLQATQITGDQRYKAYVNDRLSGLARMAAHMRANYPTATFETYPANASGTFTLRRWVFPQNLDDSGSMCAAMIKAHNAGIPNLRPSFDIFVNWVKQRQYRLSDGTFARNSPMPNSVWLDDLYMSVPCEAQIGQLNNDPRYYTDAIKQIRRFYSKMFVQGKDLFMHGWIQEMSPHPAFHWARANGWAHHGDGRIAHRAAEGSSRQSVPDQRPQRARHRVATVTGAFGAVAPVARSSGFVPGDVRERDVRVRDGARHQLRLAEPLDFRARDIARLEWRDDESEFDRPGRGHLHRHGSRLGRYVLSYSPDGRERGAWLRAHLPGGLRDHFPAPEAPELGSTGQ